MSESRDVRIELRRETREAEWRPYLVCGSDAVIVRGVEAFDIHEALDVLAWRIELALAPAEGR